MSNAQSNSLTDTANAAANPWESASKQTEQNSPHSAAAADNPWVANTPPQSAPTDAPPANPWGTTASPAPGAADTDWLTDSNVIESASNQDGFQWAQLWDGSLNVQSLINDGLNWFVDNFRPFFQAVRVPIDATLSSTQELLLSVPAPWMMLILTLLAWQLAGRSVAIGSLASLVLIGVLGIWPESMVTLSLVITSLVFCLLLGLPLGILLANNELAQKIIRPLLDAMQTTPAFVYLVPVVMLFGIGNVPGVIVTIVFALPPLVRLTNLGIRQVRPDLIEAAKAYGASPMQLLAKVQLPLAMPSIMAGINQALMLSLSMVVIASMIAVGGLGQMVLRGIGRLDMGLATIGGLGIVLLAIMLDRITQATGQTKRGATRWFHTGPIGLLVRIGNKIKTNLAPVSH